MLVVSGQLLLPNFSRSMILKQRPLEPNSLEVGPSVNVCVLHSVVAVYNVPPWASSKLSFISTDPEERRHHDCCSRSQYGQLASSMRSSVHITRVYKRRLQSSHYA